MKELSEAKVLAELLDNARQLTLFYLEHSKDLDKAKSFLIGDYRTNSILWITAHLAWAEDYLILQGVGNKGLGKAWFKDFSIGSTPRENTESPSYEEIYQTFGKLHKSSLKILLNLSDEALDETNHVGLKFKAGDSKRIIVRHCIRHESAHCGKLGMLLRMHGKKII
jgi:hypothetical protein